MEKRNTSPVPLLNPSQFDDYIFADWKPMVSGFYDKFHIARVESYKTHMRIPLQPHRRSVYFFIFITKGLAVRSKGLTFYEVKPNNFFCLPANEITSLETVDEDTEGFYCHFLPEIFNQPFIKADIAKDFPFFQFTGDPLVEVREQERIITLLEILEKEYGRNDNERFDLIPMYLMTLFSELKHLAPPAQQNAKNAATFITQRYKNALSEFIYEKKSVQEFSEYLSVSPNHLHKCVKATIGKSAHELLEDMRILEAKVLLKQTSMSIGEIAFKLGGFDPSDFSRFFKSKTNMTPRGYRQLKD
ncbi:helix-turn-helix domain-containing protein [Emticicia agri]|uniref:AraC family transcriptional regulator n=1 Tax=Emticicia agri TaxID=2492393 RepID=A0A4Q5LXP9_9BACT|nr:AraC family transcriptional regulator [Emticicia agri]RYU94534.1 AraC family transcriptional regulator [Emticicia agri]